MSHSSLRSLASLINNSISTIEQTCALLNVQLPTLDDPFSFESEAPRMIPEVSEAVSHIIAAAAQLIAIVRPAPISLMTTATQFHVSSALRVAVDTHVVEILRDAGPQGLHINDICAQNHTDPSKLSRILRLLASEHLIKEVSPDVFANNRISSAIDTGKSTSDIFKSPNDKFVGTSGIAAAVSHFADDMFKSSAYLMEALTDPAFSKSHDPNHTAFNLAFQTDLPIFSWFEKPGNEVRLRRFGIAFDGGAKMFPPRAILQDYQWGALPKDSTIVDVGGGIGTQSLVIAKEYPQFRIIVQDRDPVVAEGIKFFEENLSQSLSTGQVKFQAHDFLTPQPVKEARVYFLCMILHDWPDETCIQILRNIREAAGPTSELMIIDSLMAYACTDTTIGKDIPGGIGKLPPPPLLPNSGHAQIINYLVDVQMTVAMNGGERTLAQFAVLLEKSGWKANRVYRMPQAAAALHKIIAVPM